MNSVPLNGREKPVPGCLGRVANLFDLTSAVARNRLLTEKPHFPDGSTLSRSRSDVTRMSSPIVDDMEDKMIVSEVTRSSSTKRSVGTPVKMLIAQELSKELESTQNSPNLVAKLMGLDALPYLANGRSNSNCHSQNCYSEVSMGYWQQEDEIHQCQEQFTYKDIYEIRKSSSKTSGSRDVSPQKRRCNENTSEKKMALIRRKFMDAKRLSTDVKLRQTKEFQEALEVLSSNPDLFLKVLHEPSSLITHHLYGGAPLPVPTETKRITVLRPSKMVFNDKFPASVNRSEKQVKKSPSGNHQATWRVDESPKPTRIVVLKPSSGRVQDVLSSPRGNLQETDLFDETREVAKEITQRMRENLAGNRKDEKFIPSVFLNGYTGDESSFHKSEDEEFVGNLSDSEVMSPTSRHCWDYVNSPYSCSSLGRVSFSPESSVAREAKKRLSERWAMVSSHGSAGELRQVQRSPSTLGEMLALSDVKSEIFEVDDPKRDHDPRVFTSCLSSNFGGDVQSPKSLARSKSLPVSSTASSLRLNVEASDPGPTKQTTKSSLRGKVTSLFFPRSKKLSKEKNDKSQAQDQATPNPAESSVPFGITCDSSSQYNGSKEVKSPDVQSLARNLWTELNDKSGLGLASQQGAWSTLKPATSGLSTENQDQPSPISVLEPPFQDDGSNTVGFSDSIVPNQHGKHVSFTSGNSNLIDKSPLIGSIARTLTWDEPSTQPATTSDPLKPSGKTPQDGANEGEWLALIQSLLSAAGLENESQLISNLTRWHSPESPLDPLLREKYVDMATEDLNRRRLRSNHQLVFDFVNAALLDMTGMGSNASRWAYGNRPMLTQAEEALASRVWARMKEWLLSGGWEVEWEEEDGEDSGNMVAEMAVRKELMGREWDDQVRLEIDIIGKEIEGKLIEELVEESIGDMHR